MSREQLTKCPLCGYAAIKQRHNPTLDIYSVECPRCGEYDIHSYTVSDQDIVAIVEKNKHILSGIARELYEAKEQSPSYTNDTIDSYIKNHYLVPSENDIDQKLKKILNYIANQTKYFGELIQINLDHDYPIAYATNSREFIALLNLLIASGYIENTSRPTGVWHVQLSLKGWESTKGILSNQQEKDRAFLAVWFDDEMDPVIASMKKVVSSAGYNPICLKGEHFSDPIMIKALSEIKQSRFIVADLTGMRQSVFFEIGFAHALDIEIIYVIKNGADLDEADRSKLEYYVSHYQCHRYNNTDALEIILHDAIGARIK
ncbi:MAG: hypothetical protein WCV88_05740 [Patescibacteria group bacterium]